MKHTILALAILTTVQLVSAQEKLSREEALTYARAVSANTQQLNGTPIPTDVDAQQPVGMKEEQFGGMVLPQKNLKAEAIAKAGETPVPVGQLWLLNLTPMQAGEAVSESKLRLVSVSMDGGEATVPQCALAVRKTSAGALELLIYGKTKEPIVTTSLKAIDAKQDMPIDLAAERESESGRITVKILGKYQATFGVTELVL